MKSLSSIISLTLLLLICSSPTGAQGFRVESNSPTTAQPGSQPFVSLDGRFSISLPKQVSSYEPQSANTPAGRVEGALYTWTMSNGKFAAGYVDRPEQLEAAAKTYLDDFRNKLVERVKSQGGNLVNETELSLNGHPGREFRVDTPAGLFLFRIYLVKQRMYQLVASIQNNNQTQLDEAVKTLSSFKLLSQEEVDAQMQKLIAEATPSPLPQQPVVKKLKSDAEDAGLRGRVKTVTTESEDLSGTWTVGRRKPSSIDYYNEQGNLLKHVFYDYRGNLSDVTVYGYLEGDRVSHFKSIRYEYDPPPMMVAAPPPGQAAPRSDPRYSYKFKYSYDARGRLIEKLMYGSDGRLWLRYVYNFNGNQMEEVVYDEDGALNQKYMITLDERGNRVEEIVYDVRTGAERERYSYAYEFDYKGNWIKQTTSKWVTKQGRSFFEPAWVTYRTIVYY